jgi:tetratricopeptide (TPR) repeat protein
VSTKRAKIGFATFSFAAVLAAQSLDSTPWMFGPQGGQPVHGEIRNLRDSVAELSIVLSDPASGRTIAQTTIDGSGTFQFRSVPAGSYVMKVVRPPFETIAEQPVQVGASGAVINLDLPENPAQARPATVSTDQLQHPLSSKGAKMIRKAQDYFQSGDHMKAIEELKRALAEPSAAPYAHSLLGTEYLKTGKIDAAETELEQAIQALPHDPALHSNLGYALVLRGEPDRGEQEVRKALELDRNNSPAQRILGYILKSRNRTAQ